MLSFLHLPADLPWWTTLAIVVPAAVYGLLLLAMPFSVFGLKSRLDQIEEQLGDIQIELRALGGRLPSAPPPSLPRRMQPTEDPVRARVAHPEPPRRAEPRLDWPR